MGRGQWRRVLIGLAFAPAVLAQYEDDGISSELDNANQKNWNMVLLGVGRSHPTVDNPFGYNTEHMHPFDQLSEGFVEKFPQYSEIGTGNPVVKYMREPEGMYNEGAYCLYTPWLFQPDAHEKDIEGDGRYPDEWLDTDTKEPLDLSGLNITFDAETYVNLADEYWGPPMTKASDEFDCNGKFNTDGGCWPKTIEEMSAEGSCGEGGAGCIWFHRGANGNGGDTIFETVQKAQDAGAKAVIYSLSNPRYNTIKKQGTYQKPYYDDDEFAYGGDIELRDVEVDGFQSALHPTIPVCFISRDVGNDLSNLMVQGWTLQTLELSYVITSWWTMYHSGGFFGYFAFFTALFFVSACYCVYMTYDSFKSGNVLNARGFLVMFIFSANMIRVVYFVCDPHGIYMNFSWVALEFCYWTFFTCYISGAIILISIWRSLYFVAAQNIGGSSMGSSIRVSPEKSKRAEADVTSSGGGGMVRDFSRKTWNVTGSAEAKTQEKILMVTVVTVFTLLFIFQLLYATGNVPQWMYVGLFMLCVLLFGGMGMQNGIRIRMVLKYNEQMRKAKSTVAVRMEWVLILLAVCCTIYACITVFGFEIFYSPDGWIVGHWVYRLLENCMSVAFFLALYKPSSSKKRREIAPNADDEKPADSGPDLEADTGQVKKTLLVDSEYDDILKCIVNPKSQKLMQNYTQKDSKSNTALCFCVDVIEFTSIVNSTLKIMNAKKIYERYLKDTAPVRLEFVTQQEAHVAANVIKSASDNSSVLGNGRQAPAAGFTGSFAAGAPGQALNMQPPPSSGMETLAETSTGPKNNMVATPQDRLASTRFMDAQSPSEQAQSSQEGMQEVQRIAATDLQSTGLAQGTGNDLNSVFQPLFKRALSHLHDHVFNKLKLSTDYKDWQADQSKTDFEVLHSDFDYMTCLGVGGFGRVIEVRKQSSQQYYALKVQLKRDIVPFPWMLFLERDAMASAASFPFIVGLHYAFQTQTMVMMCLDLAGGGDLHGIIRSEASHSLTEGACMFYMAQIALALHHLHDMNIMHRDLKPDNVLVGNDGYLMLTDLGLATVEPVWLNDLKRAYADGKNLMTKKQIRHMLRMCCCGTKRYMAPEIWQLEKTEIEDLNVSHWCGPSVDWWAFGVICFELILKLRPFTSHQITELSLGNRVTPQWGNWAPSQWKCSPPAVDLMKGCLVDDCRDRLGTDNEVMILRHDVFKYIDFEKLFAKELDAPVTKQKKPSKRPSWTSFENCMNELQKKFQQEQRGFSNEKMVDWLKAAPEEKDQEIFKGFEYVAPSTLKEELGIEKELAKLHKESVERQNEFANHTGFGDMLALEK